MAVVQRPTPTSGVSAEPDPTDADLLFREAKQRERRRRLLWLGTAVIVVALAGLLAYREISFAGGTHQQPSRNETPLPGVTAGQFAGTWHVHTYYVYIRSNGQGSAIWPIHVDCGSAHVTPGGPCDTVTPETVVVNGVPAP